MLLLLGVFLASCSSVPSDRLQEVLVKKGFGRRASGDAQIENYASVGSTIQFISTSPSILLNPAFADIALLISAPQVVAVDGTIYLPNVGPVLVLGLTEKEIGTLITEQLGANYTAPPRIDARITSDVKYFFLFGEAGPAKVPMIGDLTIIDVFAQVPRTPYANLGKIRIVRGDPRNPMIITVNLRDIVIHGITTYNIQIRENDIIYVPPTFFGMLARFIEKLLLPLNTAVSAVFQASNLQYQYRVLTGRQQYFYPIIF